VWTDTESVNESKGSLKKVPPQWGLRHGMVPRQKKIPVFGPMRQKTKRSLLVLITPYRYEYRYRYDPPGFLT
jgi:hypothetical protein